MFILRKITPSNGQINIALGEHFSLIEKFESQEEFSRIHQEIFKGANTEITYGFIGHSNGRTITPLYCTDKNYIMTESGRTFSNVSSQKED